MANESWLVSQMSGGKKIQPKSWRSVMRFNQFQIWNSEGQIAMQNVLLSYDLRSVCDKRLYY